MMHVISLFIWFILNSINGQTIFNATISNSTGDYYISQQDSDFSNGNIICNPDTSCTIECLHRSSCSSSNIYISNTNTIITCDEFYACQSSIIYTNYTHYSLSETQLFCLDSYSCVSLEIKDAITSSNGYTDPNQFKIKTNSIFTSIASYPLSPTISNTTGQYYYDVGSFVTINCDNADLCFIDCTDYGCQQSTINCANSHTCMIKCNGPNDGCGRTDFMVNNINMFSFECDIRNSWSCYFSNFVIKNTNLADIKCLGDTSGTWNCREQNYYLENINSLYIECHASYGCMFNKYDIHNITDNVTFICDGGCQKMDVNTSIVNFLDIDCDGFYGACDELDIFAVSTPYINISCNEYGNCDDMKLCLDGTLNLECAYQTCNGVSYLCPGENTTNIPTSDPTIKPTVNPSTNPTTNQPTYDPITGDPSMDPTSSPTSRPTQPTTTTTADPTADPTSDPTSDPTADPTTGPTEEPTIDHTNATTKAPTSNPTTNPTTDLLGNNSNTFMFMINIIIINSLCFMTF